MLNSPHEFLGDPPRADQRKPFSIGRHQCLAGQEARTGGANAMQPDLRYQAAWLARHAIDDIEMGAAVFGCPGAIGDEAKARNAQPVENCLMAWSEGWRGKELREAIGVDQTKLDYLIKRVRRAAFKVYPKGWQP